VCLCQFSTFFSIPSSLVYFSFNGVLLFSDVTATGFCIACRLWLYVFWDVTPCGFVHKYQCLGRICHLHLQGVQIGLQLHPKNAGWMFFRKIGNDVPRNTASHPTILSLHSHACENFQSCKSDFLTFPKLSCLIYRSLVARQSRSKPSAFCLTALQPRRSFGWLVTQQ
jgi:hypothetical protein